MPPSAPVIEDLIQSKGRVLIPYSSSYFFSSSSSSSRICQIITSHEKYYFLIPSNKSNNRVLVLDRRRQRRQAEDGTLTPNRTFPLPIPYVFTLLSPLFCTITLQLESFKHQLCFKNHLRNLNELEIILLKKSKHTRRSFQED